jgi:hypothetical protein
LQDVGKVAIRPKKKQMEGKSMSKAPKPTRKAEKESGPHSTKKSVDSEVSLRHDHPGRKATREEHAKLVADHSIVADTNTVFPKHSTADKGVAALEAQIKSNRPGVTPKEKK